jgi:toxin ParE1/3/4
LKKAYVLSVAAEHDLDEIFDYTQTEFGANQAATYLLEIETRLIELSKHPATGRARNELKRGLRSYPHASHIIFYRIMNGYIRVVRVLHAKRDVSRFFK